VHTWHSSAAYDARNAAQDAQAAPMAETPAVEHVIARKVYPDTYSKFADVIAGFMAGTETERPEMLAMMVRFAEAAAESPYSDRLTRALAALDAFDTPAE
jgi:hypothetical protein